MEPRLRFGNDEWIISVVNMLYFDIDKAIHKCRGLLWRIKFLLSIIANICLMIVLSWMIYFEIKQIVFDRSGLLSLSENHSCTWNCVTMLDFISTAQSTCAKGRIYMALRSYVVLGQSPHRISAGGSLLFMRCVSLTLTGLVSAWQRGEAPSAILAKSLSDCVTVFCLKQCR